MGVDCLIAEGFGVDLLVASFGVSVLSRLEPPAPPTAVLRAGIHTGAVNEPYHLTDNFRQFLAMQRNSR